MINELDLVRDHMAGEETPGRELVLARSLLDAAISSEVGHEGPGGPERPAHHPHRCGRRNRWLVGVAAVAAASAVLILQGSPSSHDRPSIAAAAQIRHLARTVRPPVAPQAGQWSTNQMQGVLSADVVDVGNKPTPDAQASIPISFEVWSNSTGTTCTSQTFGTAGFATPANAQAWHAIGLIDAPANQPVTGCAAGVEAATGAGGMSAIDVDNLTHDAGTLAMEVQKGTTHIPVVDGAATGDPAAEAGFVRLTDLLVGPTMGTWAGFGQEMLQTLALLPGVISLGTVTAHSGQRGLGFSTREVVLRNPKTGAATEGPPPPTVILDPSTGALLEARNFAIPVLQGAAQDFVGSLSAPVYTEGVGYGISTEWIDPVGTPGVVGPAGIPAWINSFHLIEAVTDLNSYDARLSDVMDPFLGNGNQAYSDTGVPGKGQTTFDITILGTVAQENVVVAALTNSGLFQSVTVKA
jgi:hypothetical protein